MNMKVFCSLDCKWSEYILDEGVVFDDEYILLIRPIKDQFLI